MCSTYHRLEIVKISKLSPVTLQANSLRGDEAENAHTWNTAGDKRTDRTVCCRTSHRLLFFGLNLNYKERAGVYLLVLLLLFPIHINSMHRWAKLQLLYSIT